MACTRQWVHYSEVAMRHVMLIGIPDALLEHVSGE
jgi:hypothetical protein